MSYRYRKITALLGVATLMTASIAGCSSSNSSGQQKNPTEMQASESGTAAESTAITATRLNADDMFTARDKEVGYDEATSTAITLSDGKCSADSDSVTIDGSTVTITAEGTYILSGSLNDGQIQVNADETAKIQLVLKDVDIHSSSSAAIYVAQADKVFITMAEGSSNSLTTDGAFVAIDSNNIDGAVFSKSDLTLNGNGTLTVNCSAGHGIVCKKDLKITTGTYTVTAGKHALSGKNSVRIADGTFTLTSGTDAIHSEHTNNPEKGFTYIAGGEFNMHCTGDGIDASYIAWIEGGTFSISSMEAKGIKGDAAIFLDSGSITINTGDDGIHTNGDLEINAGTYSITSKDDGMHADNALVINGGDIDFPSCSEGLEASTITVNSGDISIVSSDDGFNAAGGNDQSGFDGGHGFGRDHFEADSSCALTINGGTIRVDSQGDGLDSNGSIIVTGGEIYVDGPTDNGNGALDCGADATITGGIVVAVGASGMAENFGAASTQCSMMVNLASYTSDGITLKDSNGKEIFSYQPKKSYNSVVISTPDIAKGETYTLSCGSTDTTVEMTDTIYGEGSGMGGHGGKGGHGDRDNFDGDGGDMKKHGGNGNMERPDGNPGDDIT